VSGFFEFVILIILLSMAKGTIHKYLDYRMRLVERGLGGGDRNLVRMVEEVRAEMVALKQRETEAILSFDSTLHALDSRLAHLERRILPDGTADSLSAPGRLPEERARVDRIGGAS
jgi:hypothetical protein